MMVDVGKWGLFDCYLIKSLTQGGLLVVLAQISELSSLKGILLKIARPCLRYGVGKSPSAYRYFAFILQIFDQEYVDLF